VSEQSGQEGEALEALAVVSGAPTPAELAAVTAVVDALLDEEVQQSRSSGPSAWQLSQRALRQPLRPGPGAWRSFSA